MCSWHCQAPCTPFHTCFCDVFVYLSCRTRTISNLLVHDLEASTRFCHHKKVTTGRQHTMVAVPCRQKATAGAVKGHPQCTSQKGCIGSAEDRLVQHILVGGDAGDIYALEYFLACCEQINALQGRYTDTKKLVVMP